MAATMRVPTIFSGVDRGFSRTVNQMQRSVGTFATRVQGAVGRINRAFDRLTPSLSAAQKQLLSLISAATIATAIFGGVMFSAKSLVDYEKKLASFRTIVSDLNDKQFGEFRKQIALVAKDTNNAASSIDIAEGFEKIAGLNAEFAKTADGLGKVTKAAIILSKASGDELLTSADSLVGIMNQFGFAAGQANRTINVLAAGQAVGAANISQTSEALKVFGAVAKSSNVTLEQSVGLIETLAQKQIMGSEAGTALRGTIARLQKAGFGYKSGVFQINDALEQARRKFDNLRTAKQKDAFVLKTFGLENLTAAKILMSNIGTYKEFTKSVTGTSEAQKAAAINTNTFSAKLDALKNKWVTYITTNDQANTGINRASKLIGYLTDHMDTLVDVGTKVLLFYAGWKAAVWAVNIATGVMTFLTQVQNMELLVAVGRVIAYVAALALNAVASGALATATGIMTAAQWALNVAMDANPIGLIIIAIAALITVTAVVVKKWDDWGAAISLVMGPLGTVISLVQAFRRNWDMVGKAFKTGGILGGLLAIGKVIMDSILQPIEQLLSLIGKIPRMGWAANAAAGLHNFRASMGVSMAGNNEPEARPALPSPSQTQTTILQQSTQKGQLDVNINDPGGNVQSAQGTGSWKPNIQLGTTWAK